LPNYGLLVIDPAVENGLRLLPCGETGELCITGPGVAAGYLGRPELAEKFLANPWASDARGAPVPHRGSARIDLAGNIHCLGRTDDQVRSAAFASNWAKSKPRSAASPASARPPSCCATTTMSSAWSPISSATANPR
jgi:non-ribosomal peptide synthetase component F